MPDNSATTKAIDNAGLVNSLVAGEVVKEIDLGEYSEKLKGVILKVCVNPPGVLAEALRSPTQDLTRAKMEAILSLMANIPTDALAHWPDTLVSDVFNRAYNFFWDYDAELRKNSLAD